MSEIAPTTEIEMDVKHVSSIGDLVAKIGFPIVAALGLICFLIYQSYTDGIESKAQTERITSVVAENTKASVKMTSALEALEKTSEQQTESLRSLEMRIMEKK